MQIEFQRRQTRITERGRIFRGLLHNYIEREREDTDFKSLTAHLLFIFSE